MNPKTYRITLLILLVALFTYLIAIDIINLVVYNWLNPINSFFRVLFLVSIIGVALNKSFGPKIALIINILAILGTIIVAIVIGYFNVFLVLVIIIRVTIIVFAVIVISTRSSISGLSPQKPVYPQTVYQQPTTQTAATQQVRYCPNCGASAEGDFCTSCGQKLSNTQ